MHHNRGTDLHTDANWPVAHIGPACCLYWVVVDVNDLVQVLRHLLRDLCQLVKIKVPVVQRQASLSGT